MGRLETEAAKERTRRKRLGRMQGALLLAIGVAGAAMFPAAALAAIQIVGVVRSKSRANYQLRSVAGQLASRGLIKLQKGKPLELTNAGRREFARLQHLMTLRSGKRRPWDKRWRLVVFDIPEHYRKVRDRLRIELTSFGFFQLQKSVWIFPHDCEDVIVLLKAELRAGGNVLYAIVEKIENDGKIRRYFKLP